MKIIIVGAGKVGYTLAENLAMDQNYDITVIDKDADALAKADENLDVLCIKGNGVSTNILMEAGVIDTDLIIAVTGSDEVNMLCCLTAKKLGAKKAVARVRNPEYSQELSIIKDQIGLDFVINPEFAAAEEIARSMGFTSAINVENFAKGRVRMVDFIVREGMGLIGKTIADIDKESKSTVLIGIIVRNNKVLVPNGSTVIEENDHIYVIGNPSSVYSFCKYHGKNPDKIKNVIIVGGGRITYYLYKLLVGMGINTKIIEINSSRCLELADELPNALIINDDGTDEAVLRSENIDTIDGFIAVTGIDEENIMASLIAKNLGVKKVITKVSRTNYDNIVTHLGLDTVISPKQITTNLILKFVRGKSVESLHRIVDGQAEVIEFAVDKSSGLIDKPLKNIKIVSDTIIATIVRRKEVVVPHGKDLIKAGDRIIVITKKQNISTPKELISKANGGLQNELLNGIKRIGDIINM
ncbi:MAG: Trk system potassium transporter TrkA [Clostridiales bacterium]|uniref:Trk system potassium transporter TrkA n=1 Tax=Clostridium sp. N3C TaxID=1776758 RepID=UPI00092E0B6D|nr:Trk system potassium transporter TrkA [Clostridium sp. N3C]NLZ48070.1 Trk system potassium transporter TrkA [Clostridiales bacterium]SCN23250.1 Trk system potassium uptake protein TrkA [Clostridium sp. N3C]